MFKFPLFSCYMLLVVACLSSANRIERAAVTDETPSDDLTQTDKIIIGVTVSVAGLVLIAGITYACIERNKTKKERNKMYTKYLNSNIEFVELGTENLGFEKSSEVNKTQNDVRNPQDDMRKPQVEMRKPQEDMRKPQVEMRKPQEDMRKPQEDMRKPQEDMRKPYEEVTSVEDVNRPYENVKSEEDVSRPYEHVMSEEDVAIEPAYTTIDRLSQSLRSTQSEVKVQSEDPDKAPEVPDKVPEVPEREKRRPSVSSSSSESASESGIKMTAAEPSTSDAVASVPPDASSQSSDSASYNVASAGQDDVDVKDETPSFSNREYTDLNIEQSEQEHKYESVISF